MSGSETAHPGLDDQHLAFDYVTGVMRGSERSAFARRLAGEPALQAQVNYWEEQLMNMSDKDVALAPADGTWEKIAARLQPATVKPARAGGSWFWQALSACSMVMLVACLWLLVGRDPVQQPNADYVAVLTDEQGSAQLTVLTANGGEKLWLKWGDLQIAAEKNLQLWAISKRDGQIRPLGVFAATDGQDMPITVAQSRLIKDSSHLILTEEDVGGSPLDEPSETIIAKGVCVLLANTEKTI